MRKVIIMYKILNGVQLKICSLPILQPLVFISGNNHGNK